MDQLKTFDEIYHRLLVLSLKAKLPADMEAFMKLNPFDQKIMSMVFENDNISISSLTKLLKKSKSTMTSAINRLEKKKLIERKNALTDKRISMLSLTDEGVLLQKGHLRYEEELFSSILFALDDESERENFLIMLEKITTQLEKNM